jgi:predicted RNA-binding Zn ribbon-like protein
VPWLAVRSLLRLLDEHPARVRKCANPDCPFRFLDTTRSGTRRWCSMTVCGNRLKARRHYQRHQG